MSKGKGTRPDMVDNKFATGNKGGRPEKFLPEMVPIVEMYLKECEDAETLPTVAELALRLHVSRDTIYAWGEAFEVFSDTLQDLQSYQEMMLVKYGLAGKYNPSIAKLLLSAKFNYREKSDVTSNDEALKVDVNITNAIERVYADSD